PRGTVAMDKMSHDYDGFFAGIAVHNGDPMAVPVYDDGLNLSSFPGSVTDRGNVGDPSGIEAEFLQRITQDPVAFLTNGAEYDATNRILYVSVKVDFQTNVSGDYRIACAITEDSVTGTTSGYNQVNYYAGGGSGVMGGYESLPNPVPATQMVYDHVARNILPSFAGQANSFPATVNAGDSHILIFIFNLDPTWNPDHINIVSMLVEPSGRIDNAGSATIAEGTANGYLAIENVEPVLQIAIYPNPAANQAFLEVSGNGQDAVQVMITDLMGKVVSTENYPAINGLTTLSMNLTSLSAGMYNVQVQIGARIENQKLTVK
ncbi:MAG: Omp28-related outer membrane protein, partial [Putridiphycobacter sp.]|nr:Omp28-related outer membrane protein [Putridiphycobacter sp.]